jgi:superfamily II DNA/RNA helicase
MNFRELNLHESLLEAISYMGYETPTPIQEQAIPQILAGRDILACAQTGTGKTAAFILPILDMLSSVNDHSVKTVVIVPTRELAIQIDQQIQGLGYFVDIESIAIYGGGDGSEWDQQKIALTKGADMIVATPGKFISHLNLGYVKLDKVKHLILDEADRMLDMGFHDDIQKIISFLPKKRQNLLFSATMPPKMRQLAKKMLVDPFEVTLSLSKPAEGVLQAAYMTHEDQKSALIKELISGKKEYKSILIFTSTKRKVNQIARSLQTKEGDVAEISSDLEQNEREEVLSKFKAKQIRVLVATDVLSRGIDIKVINLVINYDVPGDAEDYVHRVGRTARAETTGVALTLINEDDMAKFAKIEKLIDRVIMKIPLPPGFGPAPVWDPNARPKRNYNRKNNNPRGRKTQGSARRR